MPRSGRGGARQGTPGKAYPNRSDLRATKPLAVVAAPSRVYGDKVAELRSQQTVPMAPAPPPTTGPPAGVNPLAALLGSIGPAAGLGPGQLPPLNRPTERPNEPLTHGSPSGPGAGPEVLGLTAPAANLGQLLQSMAAGPRGNPDIAFLANYAAGGQQ